MHFKILYNRQKIILSSFDFDEQRIAVARQTNNKRNVNPLSLASVSVLCAYIDPIRRWYTRNNLNRQLDRSHGRPNKWTSFIVVWLLLFHFSKLRKGISHRRMRSLGVKILLMFCRTKKRNECAESENSFEWQRVIALHFRWCAQRHAYSSARHRKLICWKNNQIEWRREKRRQRQNKWGEIILLISFRCSRTANKVEFFFSRVSLIVSFWYFNFGMLDACTNQSGKTNTHRNENSKIRWWEKCNKISCEKKCFSFFTERKMFSVEDEQRNEVNFGFFLFHHSFQKTKMLTILLLARQ